MVPYIPSADILRHVVDVHCHPTDTSVSFESMERLEITVCAMATRTSDQDLVRDLAEKWPTKVLPAFGFHPWFTHCISLKAGISKADHYAGLLDARKIHPEVLDRLLPRLPDPTSLDEILQGLRRNFEAFPEAMLGEVGLDRAFRIPFDFSSSPRELTPFTVPFDHQVSILEAQIRLAVEMGRNVSFHSVKCPAGTLEVLAKMKALYGAQWNKISVDMHSCGLSAQMWTDIQKKYPNLFLSMSTVINHKNANHRALIAACSPQRILVESDFNDIDMCTERTWDMLRTIAEVKGWAVEDGEWDDDVDEPQWGAVRRLEENWKAFKRGNHVIPIKTPKTKEWDSEDSNF